MNKTYEEKLVSALLKRGFIEDKLDKSRYRAFVKGKLRMFVGKYGALRTGDCASRSHSIGDPQNQTQVYKVLIAEGSMPEHPADPSNLSNQGPNEWSNTRP